MQQQYVPNPTAWTTTEPITVQVITDNLIDNAGNLLTDNSADFITYSISQEVLMNATQWSVTG